MKKQNQPKAAQAKAKVKVKDIPPKKNPTGGAINTAGAIGATGGSRTGGTALE